VPRVWVTGRAVGGRFLTQRGWRAALTDLKVDTNVNFEIYENEAA
jgi:nitrogen fixation protein